MRVQCLAWIGAEDLVRGEPRAGNQTPVVAENELLQHIDHSIAQAYEAHLSGALTINNALTGNDTGNLQRLR
jgi:hypothetical protein